jgi:hypothetical protein
MERITPKAKRPRGRPLNNSKQVKIIDQAGKQHMVYNVRFNFYACFIIENSQTRKTC